MADASVLGLDARAAVRIEYDDSFEDWPFDQVEVLEDRINVRVRVWPIDGADRPVIHYPYEHAQRLPDGTWRFIGGEHAEFFVTRGAATVPHDC